MAREDVLRVTRWIVPAALSASQMAALEVALDEHAPGETILSGMGRTAKGYQSLVLLTNVRLLFCVLDTKQDTAFIRQALPLAELRHVRDEQLGDFRRWDFRAHKERALIQVRPGDDSHFQRCLTVMQEPARYVGLYGVDVGMPHSVTPVGQLAEGFGLRHIPLGATVAAGVTDTRVILESPGAPIEAWDLSDLISLQIDGQTWHSGGGYAGGGIGLAGAAVGMAAAALMNSATAGQGAVSACRFVLSNADFTIRVYNVAPSDMGRMLMPTYRYLETRESAAPPPGAEGNNASAARQGLAGEFARLAELRAAGVLTEEEFTAAKAKLLG